MRRPPEPQRPGLLRKGAWTEEEDALLRSCIDKYGAGKWRHVPQRAGLNRCRKSCRLRWLNYLSPGIKRGNFTDDEVDLIIRLHRLLGNRWSLIAGRLPGRTANDVKNYWNSHLSKQLEASSKQVGVNGDSKITFGEPQTISMNWMWSGDQLTIQARNKDVVSDALTQFSPLDNQGIVAEENMISNVDGKSSVSSVPFSGLEEFTTSLAIEEIPPDRNEGFFLEGFGELEDFLVDVNFWGDLWPIGCDEILF